MLVAESMATHGKAKGQRSHECVAAGGMGWYAGDV